MKRIFVLLLVIFIGLAALMGCAGDEKAVTAADVLSLGERYLLEMDYEQSVQQFLKLIEIDPKNPRGYLGLAEAYVALGKIAEAIQVLEQGLTEIPDNPDILAKLEQYKAISGSGDGATPATTPKPGFLTAWASGAASGSGAGASPGSGSGAATGTPSEATGSPGGSTPGMSGGTTPGLSAGTTPGMSATTSPGTTPGIATQTGTVTKPSFAFTGSKFSVVKGETFEAPYKYSAISSVATTVTVAAKNQAGASVSGFTADTSTGKVVAPKTLEVGVYTVTVTGKNSAGESSETFTLEVTAPPPAAPVKAPVITFSETKYTMMQGTALQIDYKLPNDKADTVTVAAKNATGAAASEHFSVNVAQLKINASDKLPVGVYTVTVTAKNSAGESTVTFTLEVTAPAKPVITVAEGAYTATQGTLLQVKYSLSGGKAEKVELDAESQRLKITLAPSGDSGGLINVPATLAAGNYAVTVTAKNAVGDSSASFKLEVKALAKPVITVAESAYKTQQGTALQVKYSLSGGKAEKVELDADSERLKITLAPSGDSGGLVNIPATLAAGNYGVTIFAKNAAGDSFAAFKFDVTALAKPVVTVAESYYTTPQGKALQVKYSLSGGKAEVVELAQKDKDLGLTLAPSGDSGGLVNIPATLAAGNYDATIYAKNAAGDSSAGFKFDVVALAKPVITVADSYYSTTQGIALQIKYSLTGGKAEVIELDTVSQGLKITYTPSGDSGGLINIPATLAVGNYGVTIFAKNAAGDSFAAFKLDVTGLEEPVITITESYVQTPQGTALQVKYSLSGGKAEAVELDPVSEGLGLTLSRSGDSGGLINIPAGIAAGNYGATVTAKNGAGQNSAGFKFDVTANEEPPVITETPSSTTMTTGQSYTGQFSATGSKPLKWSLLRVPSELNATIDSQGVLSIGGDIAAGDYSFEVRVENDFGYDMYHFTIEVLPDRSRIIGGRPTK